MANGGGPACLRLRVVADPAHIDPRFLVDETKLDGIADIVRNYLPESIAPDALADTRLIARIAQSWLTLVDHFHLSGHLFPFLQSSRLALSGPVPAPLPLQDHILIVF